MTTPTSGRRNPWRFLIDVLLACAPLLHARLYHGAWTSVAVYLSTFLILRIADDWVVASNRGIAARAVLKALILFVAEAAIFVSTAELCDFPEASCHPIVSATTLVVTFVAAVFGSLYVRFLFNTANRFWRIAGRHADLVLTLLASDPNCLVDAEPPDADRRTYVGPFRLIDRIGQARRIYFHHAHIDEIQASIVRQINDAITQSKAETGPRVTVHVLDSMQTDPRTETWVIDERPGRDTYEKFKDDKGELYALVSYKGGVPGSNVVRKQVWEQAAELFAATDRAAMEAIEPSGNAAPQQTPPNPTTITELEAAAQFVTLILRESRTAWPQIKRDIESMFIPEFAAADEMMAPLDLALASIALHTRSARNLFPKGQASRIEKWILRCINSDQYGEYTTNEVRRYWELMSKKPDAHPLDFMNDVSLRLLLRWAGGRTTNLVGEHGYFEPLVLLYLSDAITDIGLMYWTTLKHSRTLVRGDWRA